MALTADTIEVIQEPRLTSADGQADDSGRFPLKVLITLDVTSQATADAYVCSLEMLTQAFQAQLRPVSEDTISTIVAMWVPKRPIPSTLLREAKMLAKAKTEILQSNDWVTASEISDLAQFKSNNPGSQPNKWKLAGKIFALRREAIDYFPIYDSTQHRGTALFQGLSRSSPRLAQ